MTPWAGRAAVNQAGANRLQQGHADGGLRGQGHLAGLIVKSLQMNDQVSAGQEANRFLRPFGQLETGAGKDVAKPGVFPFTRVAEAVEVKMPYVQIGQLVGFHHRISGAFHPALHTKGAQQMAHQGGLARAQVTVQFNKRVAQGSLPGQRSGKQLRGQFVLPDQAFYNRCVSTSSIHINANPWVSKIQAWARELGFSQIGVTGVDLSSSEPGLSAWLARGFHGDMGYMAAHGLKRARPAELVPGTISVITARMDYLPAATPEGWQSIEFDRLKRPGEGIVSVYARGRDYHKVLRSRLQKLSDRIAAELGPFGHRVFTDSAPVLEAERAARSGQGWRGKHTLLLSREAGSMFFLGEIYVDLALPLSEPVSEHCGTCQACIDVCPTQAIVAPHQLDARRCISYLTIEHAGSIPLELRPLIGNRIYGCDDCQLICPWNKFAQRSALPDFDARQGLVGSQLVTLFAWTEEEFLRFTEGSPIRRIGHERWLRNIAVALGNALRGGHDPALVQALELRHQHPSALVREHVAWALTV